MQTKTIFSQVSVGENFRRADGVNGCSYDKISKNKAKPCSRSGNMKSVEFDPDMPVFVTGL